MSVTGSIPGTPEHAINVFLAGKFGGAPELRGLSFEPALPPPTASPPQSVGASSASISTTSTSTDPATDTTALADTQRWYVHRDSSGRVTVVLHLTGDPSGWVVDEYQTCEPASGSAGGVTATTMQARPVPDTLGIPPTSGIPIPDTTAIPPHPSTTTSTTIMGGG